MGYIGIVNQETNKAVDRRLARIEGQVRGLRRMIQEDAYCCDILVQIAAARSALDRVATELAINHVQHCIAGDEHAHESSKAMSKDDLITELRATMLRLMQ